MKKVTTLTVVPKRISFYVEARCSDGVKRFAVINGYDEYEAQAAVRSMQLRFPPSAFTMTAPFVESMIDEAMPVFM